MGHVSWNLRVCRNFQIRRRCLLFSASKIYLVWIQLSNYKRRRTTWILLAWSEHLKLHPCWLLIGWQKNCRNQAFSEGWICVNFWVAKKCKNQTLSEGQGIVSIFGLQKSAQLRLFENAWGSSVGFSPFFAPQGQLFWREKEETQLKNLHKWLHFLKR